MTKPSLVQTVARAIWESQRKQEIAGLAELNIDTSYLRKAGEFMVGSNRRTQVMIEFSAVSKSLAIGMRTHLSHSTERDRREMLEGFGPLATDASKLRLARLMGWIPKVIDNGVTSLRQSRNIVAHDIVSDDDISFPTNLPDDTKGHLDTTITRMIEAANDHSDTNNYSLLPQHTTGLYSLLLSLETLSAVIWGPARLRLGISTDHLSSVHQTDETPRWQAESNRNMADALLLLTAPKSSNTE